ncbi:MAG TPA: M23 family metallopeptidase [Xenococcaceae cyanobacterium]
MRHLFLNLGIVITSPLVPNIAITTSWLSSLNVSSTLPTTNFVCTKVNSQVAEICQQPTILLDSEGKVGIQPHLVDQVTNLLVPQWQRIGQKVSDLAKPNPIITKASQQYSTRLVAKSRNQSIAKLKNKNDKIPKNSQKPLNKLTFPKIARSSLLSMPLTKLNLNQSQATFAKGWTHPAPETERVASPFGWRRRPYSGQQQFHQGIDYGAPLGSPVVAAADGIVTKVVSGCLDFRNRWCGNQFGNWVEIDHGNGAIALYGHLKHESIAVQEGMKVWRNQEIAQVGSSGWSTGAHLDFRVKVQGEYQNPTSLLP